MRARERERFYPSEKAPISTPNHPTKRKEEEERKGGKKGTNNIFIGILSLGDPILVGRE